MVILAETYIFQSFPWTPKSCPWARKLKRDRAKARVTGMLTPGARN